MTRLLSSVASALFLGGWTLFLQEEEAAAADKIEPTLTKSVEDSGGRFFGKPPDEARTHHYFIAAQSETWDYAPAERDIVCGRPFPPELQRNHKSNKLRYVQYTDRTFRTRVAGAARLGILGPVLRGVVGDYLAVTFQNHTTRPLSMHPHGVKYDKDSEGAYYQPQPGRGAAIGPEATFTYVWKLDEESGPLPGEPSSKGWLYHSHVAGDEEVNLGLMGFIVVTDAKRARKDGTPIDVDREMAGMFTIFHEGEEEPDEDDAANHPQSSVSASGTPHRSWAQEHELRDEEARHAINGYVFGNLPGLEMNQGERVRWYLFGLGSEEDLHTAHWHGARVVEDGRRRTDVVELMPASMKVADMVADNPGQWLFHCHVSDHMAEGMFARFVIHPKSAPNASHALKDAFFGMP